MSYVQSWFYNIKGDVLAGLVVALALIPEAIAFSIIAGVDPMVGLYASFIISVVIAFVGGRPGMISAATGAMALLMIDLVADHGLQYLLATTILTGILQVVFGWLRWARYMRFIPRSVMVGFVNALAILIFTAQLQHFTGESWVMYAMVALTLAIIYLLPYVTKAVPSTLVAIVVVTALSMILQTGVRTVEDMGTIQQSLPSLLIPSVPLNLETLIIILPYAIALTVVGLLESLLTATIVDDMTDTPSDKNRESQGQGLANIAAGFFGGMAGCAMIGQSVINVKSGGKGRLSALVAGVFLVPHSGKWVVQIPMAALAGVMIMVSISTFDWGSVKHIRLLPRTDAMVMIVTVAVVVLTHNLAIGVFTGVILSAIFFVAKISKVHVESKRIEDRRVYEIRGELFFASVTDMMPLFDVKEDIQKVELDFTLARLWDDSAVVAVEKLVGKFQDQGIETILTGLTPRSQALIHQMGNKFTGH